MRSTFRLAFVLLIAGIGSYFASQTASAAVGVDVPDSCSVALEDNGTAIITIDPGPSGTARQIFRQGNRIDAEFLGSQAVSYQRDSQVPNLRDVHYSVFAGEGKPRVYCGFVTPVLKTCSVSVTAGNPVIGWSSNTADMIWRNGKPLPDGYGSTAMNIGQIYDYRLVDYSAGAIGQLGHYSVQWLDGSRTYCGNVTVPGRAISCSLSVYYEGLPYVRVQGNFDMSSAPGKAILFRNGHQTSFDVFYDETNGLLDGSYTPNVTNHYSLVWRNDQGELTNRAYCGSIVPPERI